MHTQSSEAELIRWFNNSNYTLTLPYLVFMSNNENNTVLPISEKSEKVLKLEDSEDDIVPDTYEDLLFDDDFFFEDRRLPTAPTSNNTISTEHGGSQQSSGDGSPMPNLEEKSFNLQVAPRDKILCYLCGKPGHIRRQCPNNKGGWQPNKAPTGTRWAKKEGLIKESEKLERDKALGQIDAERDIKQANKEVVQEILEYIKDVKPKKEKTIHDLIPEHYPPPDPEDEINYSNMFLGRKRFYIKFPTTYRLRRRIRIVRDVMLVLIGSFPIINRARNIFRFVERIVYTACDALDTMFTGPNIKWSDKSPIQGAGQEYHDTIIGLFDWVKHDFTLSNFKLFGWTFNLPNLKTSYVFLRHFMSRLFANGPRFSVPWKDLMFMIIMWNLPLIKNKLMEWSDFDDAEPYVELRVTKIRNLPDIIIPEQPRKDLRTDSESRVPMKHISPKLSEYEIKITPKHWSNSNLFLNGSYEYFSGGEWHVDSYRSLVHVSDELIAQVLVNNNIQVDLSLDNIFSKINWSINSQNTTNIPKYYPERIKSNTAHVIQYMAMHYRQDKQLPFPTSHVPKPP
jgi:hypothetical protein